MSAKKKVMKKEKKSTGKFSGEISSESIKVQLDSRTIIFVRSKGALKSWMSRYPKAKIIA